MVRSSVSPSVGSSFILIDSTVGFFVWPAATGEHALAQQLAKQLGGSPPPRNWPVG